MNEWWEVANKHGIGGYAELTLEPTLHLIWYIR